MIVIEMTTRKGTNHKTLNNNNQLSPTVRMEKVTCELRAAI